MKQIPRVGLFDSGVGGLSILRKLLPLFPHTSFVYLADTARLPYGNKSPEEIRLFTYQNLSWLKSQGVQFVIVACNTGASLAFDDMRRAFHLPILTALHPTVDFVAQHRIKRLALWATPATIKSGAFAKALTERSPHLTVRSVSCPELVPLIESGKIDTPELETAIQSYLDQSEDADAILYGCTHYPFIEPVLRNKIPHSIQLIDPADAVANYMRVLWTDEEEGAIENVQFAVTGEPEPFSLLAKKLLLQEIAAEHVKIDGSP